MNHQLSQMDPNRHLNFAFSNSFNTSLVLQNPLSPQAPLFDQAELQKLLAKTTKQHDVFLTMKSNDKLNYLLQTFNDLIKIT